MVSNPSDVSDSDGRSDATGSFVHVKEGDKGTREDTIPDDANDQEPDIYDINVLAWDSHASPLHLAIVNGHVEAVEELVSSFGADVLLPVKLLNEYNNSPKAAILTLVLAQNLPLEKAKVMTTKLLQLGASAAQADMHEKTALHELATIGYSDLIDVYLDHDRPAVERAANHLSASGYYSNPVINSALLTAIKSENTIGAIKLLEANAKPDIPFEDYAEAAKNIINVYGDSLVQQKEVFHDQIIQPIVLAVRSEQPLVALELLAHGADPNTLDPKGAKIRLSGTSPLLVEGTILDCVRAKIEDLREYQGEAVQSTPPQPLEDDSVYLEGLKDDTYQMWTAKAALEKEKMEYETEKKRYADNLERTKTAKGLDEKKAAVQALICDFEKLETELLARGAKTIKELRPDMPDRPVYEDIPYNTETQSPRFKINFTFRGPAVTEAQTAAYIKLFEAAWCGDLDTIKTLTLGPNVHHTKDKRQLLEIGITDSRYFSPFSIAVVRGHLDVAKAILVIANAQYKPPENKKISKYDAYVSDYEDESEDDELNINQQTISDKFTIDNIGEIKAHVESNISPLAVLAESCQSYVLFDKETLADQQPTGVFLYAIWKDDVNLLTFLLGLYRELFDKASEADRESDRFNDTSGVAFCSAVRLGRLRCLEELIKSTGAGLPLDQLAEKSGVEAQEKPVYYQGLSIHGKKREDWAATNRGMSFLKPRDMHPPLLLAAFEGSLEAVECFLGTAPSRYYIEFTKKHKHDKRLKRLAQSEQGIEKTIENWLSLRHELVLHCAVMAKTTEETERLVEYLVKSAPYCLEVKSADGYTPLAIAFSLHRLKFAKILVAAGANQTARDKLGNNILHLLLGGFVDPDEDDLDTLRSMLDLIDPLLVSSLLTERSYSVEPGSLTPLAQWMARSLWGSGISDETENKIAVLQAVLDFAEPTGQKHLELLDGAGNTVLHDAARCQLSKALPLMLERRPDLLLRENATGSTPADLADDAWVGDTISTPAATSWPNTMLNYSGVAKRTPESFVEPPRKEGHRPWSKKRKIHEICHGQVQGDESKKRRLVTLFEANEVAKRLAAKQTNNDRSSRRSVGGGSNEDDEGDEVSVWIHQAR
ncbi:hypothetical protein ASPZODRAFT_1024550 [Penicilliopsis zonata CBS 506.65]|uniref:Ankyrin repeat protein n=1 Tax=Penicilliopsis zonata CBS 506.65 TaxID=1073090 RepID=A0A1L9SRR7_9EURO|nr:hypothetical protein ASPZODRAFT_1024550 [Penicilliopsis zonata CBS 506.65]OJJ49761.1 hypothetical protein ASPZODRAFT_1024550 [Penicilliopsis zonata CBS 506.65]